MKITFCGHSEISRNLNITNKILQILKEEVSDGDAEFYLGGYGKFDFLALKACRTFRQIYPRAKIYFITPYLDEKYLKNRNLDKSKFDGVLFPPIEKVPKKYAIIERNKWMVAQSDLVIAFIDHSWGGAAKTFDYAFKTHKQYINLGTYDPNYYILQKSRV